MSYWSDNWWKNLLPGYSAYNFVSNVNHQLETWNTRNDDPEFVDDLKHKDIFVNPFVDYYQKSKENEDWKRYYEDLEKNTGQSWRNSKYPWAQYRGTSLYSSNTGFSEMFEASQSVIMGLSKTLNRWYNW